MGSCLQWANTTTERGQQVNSQRNFIINTETYPVLPGGSFLPWGFPARAPQWFQVSTVTYGQRHRFLSQDEKGSLNKTVWEYPHPLSLWSSSVHFLPPGGWVGQVSSLQRTNLFGQAVGVGPWPGLQPARTCRIAAYAAPMPNLHKVQTWCDETTENFASVLLLWVRNNSLD